jgi:FixJ family two-component response regulator
MGQIRADPSASKTSVLLIETDANARAQHETLLVSVGYSVLSLASFPDLAELQSSAVVITDIPSFHWLRAQEFHSVRPILVIAEDCRAGVTACLCGAADWIPSYGEPDYLLGTLAEALQNS